MAKLTPFKSPLNKWRCDKFTEIPDPEQKIEQDMEDDIDEQDNIEESKHSPKFFMPNFLLL